MTWHPPVPPWPARPLANSFWIDPGRLLAGEYPGEPGGAAGPESTRSRLDSLLRAGVSYFIDLTRAGELPPYDHLLPEARADDRYIIYVRRAIPDHGVPTPESMAETLDYVDRAIEVGHQVYVHCRAGIGRTNTVVGCWLRRRGLTGTAALERLNELWLDNARSATWPRVPETPEQTRFVLDWREPGGASAEEPEPPDPVDFDAARALRDRYLGSLFGLACGDAAGSTLQFGIPGRFIPVADMLGGGRWQLPRGGWTDDTALALCTAQSLLAQHGLDSADQLRGFREWQQTGAHSSTGQCIGITSALAAALAGAPPSVADSAEGLPRAGMVALFGASAPATVFESASACVGLTHRAPAALSAGRYQAALVLAAVRGASRASLIEDARELLGAPGILALDPAVRRLATLPGYPAMPAGQGGESAAGVLQTILWSLGASAGFREGLLKVVNLGGDADLRGAVYGQLAGALHGARSLPRAWTGALLRRELLEETADGLLAAALAPHA